MAAVVVARERTGTLREVLEALRGQTRRPDRLLVVLNDATDAVRGLIADLAAGEPRIETIELAHNAGGAGGFSAGIDAVARWPDADFAWVFDDDAVPAADCLERLLAAVGQAEDLGAVGAASADPDGQLAWSLHVEGRRRPVATLEELREAAHGGALTPVLELAWHALLIPTTVIRSVGPPWGELFMWYEDVEYGLRLRRAGLRLYAVPDAGVSHPPPPRMATLRLPGLTIAAPVMTPWRTYLMVRNSLVVRHRHTGRRFWVVDGPLELLRGVIAVRALPRPRRGLVGRVLARACRDAARGRLGPPPKDLFG